MVLKSNLVFFCFTRFNMFVRCFGGIGVYLFLILNVCFRRNRAVVKCWHRNSGPLFGTRDRVFSRGDCELGRARFSTQQVAVRD